MTVRSYRVAKIKFNGGTGALLCSACDKVIATGFDHEDTEHWCSEACQPPKIEPIPVNDQFWNAEMVRKAYEDFMKKLIEELNGIDNLCL